MIQISQAWCQIKVLQNKLASVESKETQYLVVSNYFYFDATMCTIICRGKGFLGLVIRLNNL